MGRGDRAEAGSIMHRFFVKPEQICGDQIVIAGEEFKHAVKALRIRDNELFEVCDGNGYDYHCLIARREREQLTAAIQVKYPSAGELPYAVTLFQGLPKGQKMDEIVQKNTELGIGAVVPFVSAFCVAKLEKPDKAAKKRSRWQRIAFEAAKQSKRGRVPQVHEPVTFQRMCERVADFDLVLLAYEHELDKTLQTVLEGQSDSRKIAVIVGPEGGFSLKEAEKLEAAGAKSISLGKRILRTETAGMALLAQINYAFGQ